MVDARRRVLFESERFSRVPLALPVLDYGKAVRSVALAEPVAHNHHVSHLTHLPSNTIWC